MKLVVYQVLANRRTAYDNLFWQAPVLSLTAQAFLFTVALSGGTPVWARRIAALLALLSALAAIQLMVKHRYHETLDSKLCQKLEEELHIQHHVGFLPHGRLQVGQRLTHPDEVPFGWAAWSSYKVWRTLLLLFALAAVTVIIMSFTTTIFTP